MLISLLATASATAFGPYPEAIVVDEACQVQSSLEPGAELLILYQSRSQSCAPGGPCSLIQDDPADPRELWLLLADCPQPLEGRFKPTPRSCDGKPVWRWTEPLPSGRGVSISGTRGSSGWVELSGETTCPPEEPAVLLDESTEEVTPRAFFPHVPPGELRLVPTDGGDEIQWTLQPEWSTQLYPEGRLFRADPGSPQPGEAPDGLAWFEGAVTVEETWTRRTLKQFGLIRCEMHREQRATLRLQGSELTLSSVSHKDWVNPGTCPAPTPRP